MWRRVTDFLEGPLLDLQNAAPRLVLRGRGDRCPRRAIRSALAYFQKIKRSRRRFDVHIGVPLETQTGETRVAATPETIKKLIGQGHKVTVRSGAGINASVVDSAYEAAGATIGSANDAFGAELILKVVAPSDSELSLIKSGTVLVGMLNPFS